MVHLSERMRCVAGMVSPGGLVCDVGCDHGFVSVYLIQNGIADRVIAMDIGRGPLERAKEHIRQYGLEDKIETRLSDGLKELRAKERADTVILAGMGGPLMVRIIYDAMCRGLSVGEYILQPQSRPEQLRAFLRANAYETVEEDMILEDGKFYPVMKVLTPRKDTALMGPGQEEVTADDAVRDLFGPLLLKRRHPVLHTYLIRQQEKFTAVREECIRKQADASAVLRQLALVEAGLKYFM